MKKIVFYQKSVILCIGLILFSAFIIAGLYVIVEFFVFRVKKLNGYDWIGVFAALFSIIFMGYTFIRMARNKIVLSESEVFVPEHWGNKDHKLQYETHIEYVDIRDILMIISDKNSLGKSVRWVFIPMPYILFDCKDGQQKAINVFYYSKRQVVQIIDEVRLRAKKLGNDLQAKTGLEILNLLLKQSKEKK